MTNNNQLIILDLQQADNNAEAVKRLLIKWDKSEQFPEEHLESCFKFHQWSREDFDYEAELMIKEYLPDFMLDVFFDVKDFRSNIRNELVSTCETYAKVMGYPMKTQDDKAFCQYKYYFAKRFNDSRINKN